MAVTRVSESDSLESVMLRIQTCKGFEMNKQKLVCSVRELAKDGDVLHLIMRVGDVQVISNVSTYAGKEFTLSFEKFKNVWRVKKRVEDDNVEDDQEVFCDGVELGDQQQLIDEMRSHENTVVHFIISKSAKVQTKSIEKILELSTVKLNAKKRKRGDYFNGGKDCKKEQAEATVPLKPVILNPQVHISETVQGMIRQTLGGLEKGHAPVKTSEGTGGAYFMKDSSGEKIVSVFKPVDEEPNAVNNPNRLPVSSTVEGLKKGTKVGQGAFREVAAYLLDHPKDRSGGLEKKGFAGVPPTFMVNCFHSGFNHQEECTAKLGSLQKFVPNIGSCDDMGPGSFPVNQVHKLSVLDVRMANADRHAGNILISKDEDDGHTVLVPIDHGYCLPECIEDCTFEWLYWPQARQPYSPETLEYIKTLDAEEDISTLKLHGWDMSQECARTLRVSTMLLKKGAARGLTPFAIGSIMCRETLSKPSVLEDILQEAEDSVAPESGDAAAFLDAVSRIMDCRLA